MQKRRTQLRIPGVSRMPTGSALLPSIQREIDRCALRYNCSRSFVVAVALEEFFGVRIFDDFRHEVEPEQIKSEAKAIAKRENKILKFISNAA